MSRYGRMADPTSPGAATWVAVALGATALVGVIVIGIIGGVALARGDNTREIARRVEAAATNATTMAANATGPAFPACEQTIRLFSDCVQPGDGGCFDPDATGTVAGVNATFTRLTLATASVVIPRMAIAARSTTGEHNRPRAGWPAQWVPQLNGRDFSGETIDTDNIDMFANGYLRQGTGITTTGLGMFELQSGLVAAELLRTTSSASLADFSACPNSYPGGAQCTHSAVVFVFPLANATADPCASAPVAPATPTYRDVRK